MADVTPAIDPLDPRPPLATWSAPQDAGETVKWFIDSLALFIAQTDIERLNAHLTAKTAGGYSKADSRARVSVSRENDFAIVRAAIDQLASEAMNGKFDGFSAKPFRRAVLMSALNERLGMPGRDWCCTDDRGMPPAKTDQTSGQNQSDNSAAAQQVDPAIKLFYRDCAPCHRTSEPTPPNFLLGNPEEVRARLAQCAERI